MEWVVFHFGAKPQLFPTAFWQQLPCRSQLCPRDQLFQSASLGIAWAGGIPQRSKPCSAQQRHQQK